jgi:hypothetical protein
LIRDDVLRRACASSAAAWLRPAISESERPASSARSWTTTDEAFFSLRTFWVKAVWRLAISELRAFILVLSESDRLAPARTKSR